MLEDRLNVISMAEAGFTDEIDENGETFEEKVNQIRIYSGKKYNAPESVTSGTVCAVTGLTEAYSGNITYTLYSLRYGEGEWTDVKVAIIER